MEGQRAWFSAWVAAYLAGICATCRGTRRRSASGVQWKRLPFCVLEVRAVPLYFHKDIL